MSSVWHWFIIIGTIGSLIALLLFLLSNRKVSGQETTGHDWDGIQELDNPLPLWWVGMFIVSIVFAAGYLLYYPGLGRFGGLSGWTSADQVRQDQERQDLRFAPLYARLAAMSEAELHQDRTAQQVGRRLFLNNCASCHGVTARGGFGFPDLTDGEWLGAGTFEYVKQTLASGRQAVMTPWQAVLGDAGIDNMAQYVRSLSGNEHDAAMAAQAEPQFSMFCVACHGPGGKGNPILGAPDLTNDIWLYGGSVDQITFTLRHGRNGNMPAFGDILDAQKRQVLAAYVTSLSQKTSQ